MITNKDDDSHTARLERMRVSQRKLRDQRKQELETVKQQNQNLAEENRKLSEEIDRLRGDISHLIGVFDGEITGPQLEKLYEISNGNKNEVDIECVEIQEVIASLGGPQKGLIVDDHFILKDVCKKQLHCFHKVMSSNRMAVLSMSTFRYLKTYGLSLLADFIGEIQCVITHNKVPRSWLQSDIRPKGTLGFLEMFRYYLRTADLDIIHTEVFASFLAKYSFATPTGPAIFEQDLFRSIKYSTTLEFDSAFLLGYIDDDLCERTYLRGPVPSQLNATQQASPSMSFSTTSGPHSTASTAPTSEASPL